MADFTGGPGNDVFTGTAADDTAAGNGGDDVLNGGPGADLLDGGAGNDRLNGGTGTDSLTGGPGNDWFYIESAGDTVVEAADGGTDRILTSFSYTLAAGFSIEVLTTTTILGTAAINLTGNELVNTVAGNAGNNVLDGGAGADTLNGFGGDDWYFVDNVGDVVLETVGYGTDRVLASVSYRLGAGREIEVLSTTDLAGSDAIDLTGNEFWNTLAGNAGNNVLDGGAGMDTLRGYGGDDWYYVDNGGDAVEEATGQGTDRVLASASYRLAAGQEIELLTTTDITGTAAIGLTGNELVNTLVGNAGANVLDGGAGADTLRGLGGDDWYYVDHAGDVIDEVAGQGTDRVLARIDYVLPAGLSIEQLSTASIVGTDAIDLTGNELANVIAGNAASNILRGGAGNDTLNGYDGTDELDGGDGNDTLDGNAGNDILRGGAGDDIFFIERDDVVFEDLGGGNDHVVVTLVSLPAYSLPAGQEIERLTVIENIEDDFSYGTIFIWGNEFDNIITGTNGGNDMGGNEGADILAGLDGGDWYYVDHADVVIEEVGTSPGADSIVLNYGLLDYTLPANVEGLYGSGTLIGNELANTIYGHVEDDIIDGGAGADELQGQSGADSFRFTAALEAGNIDTILEYAVADDTIELDDAVFTGLAPGALSARAFQIGAAAADDDDRIIYNSATGTLSFDADGNGAGAAVQFATLSSSPEITASEFFVI